MSRKKLVIIKARSDLTLQIMPAKSWDRIVVQHSIDKIEQELGVSIKDCQCHKCQLSRGMVNQILGLAMALEIEGLEYTNDKNGKKHRSKQYV